MRASVKAIGVGRRNSEKARRDRIAKYSSELIVNENPVVLNKKRGQTDAMRKYEKDESLCLSQSI